MIKKKWDWRAILISLILSFTFWVFHSLNADHTANIRVPVQVLPAHADSMQWVQVSPPAPYIHVNVSGYGWTILRRTLGIGLSTLQIDIANPLQERHVPIKPFRPAIDEILQEMRSINYILEDSLFFHYDTLAHKTLHLTLDPDTVNLVENHRIISDIILAPSVVEVHGPASVLATYPDTLYLTPGPTRLSKSYDEQIPVPLAPHPLVRMSENVVNVMFDVGLFFPRKIDVPVSVINFPNDRTYEIDPPEISIEFYILASQELTPDDYLLVLLDYDDYQAADSVIVPKIYLPQKMHDVVATPKKIKVYPLKK